MSFIIKRINIVLLIVLGVTIVAGLILMATGNEKLSTDFFLIAAVTSPIFLATKGIGFIIENQLWKAFLSILLLSVVCMLSILFVFVQKVQHNQHLIINYIWAVFKTNFPNRVQFFDSLLWNDFHELVRLFFEVIDFKRYFYLIK